MSLWLNSRAKEVKSCSNEDSKKNKTKANTNRQSKLTRNLRRKLLIEKKSQFLSLPNLYLAFPHSKQV